MDGLFDQIEINERYRNIGLGIAGLLVITIGLMSFIGAGNQYYLTMSDTFAYDCETEKPDSNYKGVEETFSSQQACIQECEEVASGQQGARCFAGEDG